MVKIIEKFRQVKDLFTRETLQDNLKEVPDEDIETSWLFQIFCTRDINQFSEEIPFNVGSISKVLGFYLLVKKLTSEERDPNEERFVIGFEDIKEAIWRGEINYFINNKHLSLILDNLGVSKEVIEKIVSQTKLIKEGKLEFSGSILQQVKEGLFDNDQNKQKTFEISFEDLCFFGLTVSSNASYLSAINKLLEFYPEANGLYDIQDELKDIIGDFDFIKWKERYKQNLPNASFPSSIGKAFEKIIQELSYEETQGSFKSIMLRSLENNSSFQGVNITPFLLQMQAEGIIPDDYKFFEKTGISVVVDYGKCLYDKKIPPNITYSSVITIMDGQGKIIGTFTFADIISTYPILPNLFEEIDEEDFTRDTLGRIKMKNPPEAFAKKASEIIVNKLKLEI